MRYPRIVLLLIQLTVGVITIRMIDNSILKYSLLIMQTIVVYIVINSINKKEKQ